MADEDILANGEEETPEEPQVPEEPQDWDSEEVAALKKAQKGLYEKYRTTEKSAKDFKGENEQLKKDLEEAKRVQGKSDETPPAEEEAKKEVLRAETALDPIKVMDVVATFKDYSSDELRIVARNAKGAGISLEEAAKLEDVQLAIQGLRNKVAQDDTTPEPSFRSVTIAGKKVDDMTPQERRENYEEIMRKSLEKGKGQTRGRM